MLHRGEGWNTVLDALRGGKGLVHVVTIPEGFALYQIRPLLAAKLGVAPESVDVATRDTALLHELDIPTPTLEGYLFPDTYVFPEGTTARAAVDVMVKKFEQVWLPAWTARLDTLHMTRNDVMALAAIVEKEAKLPQERPVIAAVYTNRLKHGMLLQADPTVQYALGKHVALWVILSLIPIVNYFFYIYIFYAVVLGILHRLNAITARSGVVVDT